MYTIFFHRLDKLHACYCTTKWRGVKIRFSCSFDMKSSTLKRNESFIHKIMSTINKSCSLCSILECSLWNIIIIIFIILTKICCISIGNGSFMMHPGNSTTCIESTTKGDTDFFSYRKRGKNISHILKR